MATLNINDAMSVKAYGTGYANSYDRYILFGNGFTVTGTPRNVVINSTAVNSIQSSLSAGYTLIDPTAQAGQGVIKKLVAGTGVTMVSADNSITINASGGSINDLTDATNDGDSNMSLGVKYAFSGGNNLVVNNIWAPTSFTGSLNVILGNTSNYVNLTSANSNVLIGVSAGYNISTGNGNIFIGINPEAGITTGNNNIVLGTNAGNTVGTGGDNIVIGIDADMIASGCGGGIAFGQNAASYSNAIAIGPSSRCNSVESVAIGYHATANLNNGFYTMGSNNGTSSLANIDQNTVTDATFSGKALVYNSATGQLGPLAEGAAGQSLMTDGFGQLYWGPEYLIINRYIGVNNTFAINSTALPVAYNLGATLDMTMGGSANVYNSPGVTITTNTITINTAGYYKWNLSGIFASEPTGGDTILNYKINFGLLDADDGTTVYGEGMLTSLTHTEFNNLDGDEFNMNSMFFVSAGTNISVAVKQRSHPGLNSAISALYFYKILMSIEMILPNTV